MSVWETPSEGSSEVGASPFGALQMAGNVWEWVQDCYHSSYSGAPAGGGAWEDSLPVPADGGGCTSSSRVVRGGGFYDSAAGVRAARRVAVVPPNAADVVGFRCCRPNVPACSPSQQQACDDGDPCTVDHCDPLTGCYSEPLDCSGLDGGGGCLVGVCVAGSCEAEVAVDGTSCDDGNPGTSGDACGAGACIPGSCGALGAPCPEGFLCESPYGAPAGAWYCLSVDEGPDRVWAPPGTFWMGCTAGNPAEPCLGSEEAPMHSVTFAAGFSILRTEVTASEYDSNPQNNCEGTLNSGGGSSEVPMAGLDWCASRSWCESLGVGWGLCTEAQWEYAARGSCELNGAPSEGWECKAHMRVYPWGNSVPTCDLAAYEGCPGSAVSVWEAPMGGSSQAGASPYGALHMVGNVEEWVQDCYHPSYSGAPGDGGSWEDVLPVPADGTGCTSSERVRRGGAFHYPKALLHAAQRHGTDASHEYDGIGLRCCRGEY